jgi:pimeloyl-ACP methyl ester carboxylesterase
VHGWPDLSISWRGQLPVFGALGFRAVAPDMRGYGRSSVYPRHEDYALEGIVGDMLELLGSLGADKAIWVGHDWGAPVVWSVAQRHPELCHGVANLSCLTFRKGLRSRRSFRWQTEPSIRPTDFQRRNRTINCSTARISHLRRRASRVTWAQPSARSSAPEIPPAKASLRPPHSPAPMAVGSAPLA